MGLFSFVKDAGAKLFGGGESEEEKAKKVTEHVRSFKIAGEDVNVSIVGDKAIVEGTVDSVVVKNKLLATAGNVTGIASVEDRITVTTPVAPVEPEKQFYTVKSGDNLSKIAKEVYGDANKYPVIFEANEPMLTHPDKIYPGQALVIPQLA